MAHAIEKAVVSIPLSQSTWIDTGIVIKAGNGLRLSAHGIGGLSGGNGAYPIFGQTYWLAYPEGTYATGDAPRGTEAYLDHAFSYAQVKTYGTVLRDNWIVSNTRPASLNIVIREDGSGPPPNTANSVNNAYATSRDTIIADPPTGRVWAIFNDIAGTYADNYGTFTLEIERLGTTIGANPSPTRYSPPALLQKRATNEMTLAWCIAVKPIFGEWEAFTSWDEALDLPAYGDALGNLTPALTYHPTGADVSNIPTQLKLGAGAVDAKILAPRADAIQQSSGEVAPTIYLDRSKILRKFYEGAYWELFDLDPEGNLSERQCWTCGEIGNIQLDDLTANAELATYEEIFNREVGDVLHVICQVGSRRGEKFGLQRCRCEVIHNGVTYALGIRREDWRVEATVKPGSTQQAIALDIGNIAQSGAFLHADFKNRLTEGDLEFWSIGGGQNQLVEMPIRGSKTLSAGSVEVYPKLALPYAPAAGDKLWLVSGCDKTKPNCIRYNNLPQMAAQDLPSQDDLLRRTRI